MTQLIRADNEWRFDLLDEAFTVIARNRRSLEPLALALPASEQRLQAERSCAFCEGTPLPVLDRVRGADGREVVALPSPTPLAFVEDGVPPAGPFASGGALGAHELLVATGRALHRQALPALDEQTLTLLLYAFARRRTDLSGDARLGSLSLALPPPALSRLDHAHAALLATPFAAPRWSSSELCPACRELQHARAHGRLVVEREGIAAWVPFAPRSDVHVRVAPVAHGTTALAPDEAEERCLALAQAVHDGVRRLSRVAPDAPLLLSARPLPLTDDDEGRSGHLVLELEALFAVDEPLARALGARVTCLPPEELAERLREA